MDYKLKSKEGRTLDEVGSCVMRNYFDGNLKPVRRSHVLVGGLPGVPELWVGTVDFSVDTGYLYMSVKFEEIERYRSFPSDKKANSFVVEAGQYPELDHGKLEQAILKTENDFS